MVRLKPTNIVNIYTTHMFTRITTNNLGFLGMVIGENELTEQLLDCASQLSGILQDHSNQAFFLPIQLLVEIQIPRKRL